MARPRGAVPPPPNRTIRVEEELWEDSKRVAKDRGESVNAAIVRFLHSYVDQHPSG